MREITQAKRTALAESYSKFCVQYPTDADCEEALCRIAEQMGLANCRKCGSTEMRRSFGSRTIVCANCKRKRSIFSGTYFHGIRRAKPWLAAIWFKAEQSEASPLHFAELVGICYASAWALFQKLAWVAACNINFADCVVSALFSEMFCKRTRETPKKLHPRAEEGQGEVGEQTSSRETSHSSSEQPPPKAECMDAQVRDDVSVDNRSGASQDVPDDGSAVSAHEGAVTSDDDKDGISLQELISTEIDVCTFLSDVPIHFDELVYKTGLQPCELSATLMILELDSAVSRKPGDFYTLPRTPSAGQSDTAMSVRLDSLTEKVKIRVKELINLIAKRYQRIGRKYLQLYLADSSYELDRERWGLNDFIQFCFETPRLRYADLLSYVTPQQVRI